MTNLYMPISAAIISSILLIVYCTKEKVKIKENTVYLYMMIFVLLDSLFVTGIYINAGPGESIPLTLFLNRCDYVVLIGWTSCLCRYSHAVIHKKDEEIYRRLQIRRRIITAVALTACVLVWILGLEPVIVDGVAQAIVGPAVYFTFSCCAVFLVACLAIILLNIRKVTKQILPVFIFLGIAGLIAVTYFFDPGISGVSMGLTIVNLTMYFTIENPDVQMLEKVNLSREQAQRANQAKTDFLSSMSHEIRTHINAIVGFAECIKNDNSLEMAKEDAGDIIIASENLLEIINGILDISKIEAGRMEVVNKEYDLVEMSENLSKLIKARIGEKPIELRPNFSSEIPGLLYGDETKIRQIMTNLLTNAVKYTEKGHIDFVIDCVNTEKSSELTITVSDTGHGIKEEAIDGLFDKFKRLEEDRNSNIEGTGLGLAITKQFVEMLGGTIEVHSVYGKGSSFIFKVSQDIRSLSRKRQELTEEIQKEYPGHKVLVVDDIAMNRMVAKRILNLYKVDVEVAASGAECIEKCKSEVYDLILLDDMMPNMSGTETLKILVTLPDFAVPVIAFTANAIDGMRENYINEGYTDYISKPLVKGDLSRVLERFLG